jgi:glycosyltransferase involved in cell wall biosynthesis
MKSKRPPGDSPADRAGTPIVVHSHLRWDFVWQRPQQLLSRLAANGSVLFVEEPVYVDDAADARLEVTRPDVAVYRAIPMLPAALRGRYDESIATVRDLLRHRLAGDAALSGLFHQPIQWFYTPMPAPAMIGAFDERAVVYDCMDELSKFRFAPAELIDREAYLMAHADVVFTGGYHLWELKSKRHANVHFFGCGVDGDHFGTARAADLPVPAEIAALGKPVVGYYGVVDERIDYDLLRRLAEALPEAAIVMVGPVVKVDPRELPQAPNLHWLGQRQYAELPAYLKGFDVCLMPFALNDATEFINPTKTLEYMAAGKPIVSTAISDVVHHFTPVVAVARSPEEFVAATRRALLVPERSLIERGLAQARANSWEEIVARMEHIMASAVRARAMRATRGERAHAERSTTQRHATRSAGFAMASDGTAS